MQIKLVEQVELTTGYFFKKLIGEFACFISVSSNNNRVDYHYYKEIKCSVCKKPYAHKKYGKTTSHRLCSNRKTAIGRRL